MMMMVMQLSVFQFSLYSTVLSVLFVIPLVIAIAANTTLTSEKTIIFISGFPQSGTSLIQQIYELTPYVSTMIKKCPLYHKTCDNFNNEGQWLLGWSNSKESADAVKLFNPGSFCANYHNQDSSLNSTSAAEYIVNEWSKYWDLQAPVLVEKSPQNMLKIPLLKSIFNASRTKFLVVVKNPVTLNIALPKGYEWDRRSTHSSFHRNEISSHVRQVVYNTISEKQKLAEYFIDFMTHDLRSNHSSVAEKKCSLGWLPTMDTFFSQLLNVTNGSNYHISPEDIRIVRYEDFDFPYTLCVALMRFTFGDQLLNHYFMHSIQSVCRVHFLTNELSASSNADATSSRSKESGNSKLNYNHSHKRRSLRLKTTVKNSYNKLLFHKDAVSTSVIKRLSSFQNAYVDIVRNNTIARKLHEINILLSKYGYCFIGNCRFNYHHKNNLLDYWDLLKNEEKLSVV